MRKFSRLRSLARLAVRNEAGVEDGDPAYVCRGCGVGYELQYHTCPGCGSFAVESTRYDAPAETVERSGSD